MEGEVEKETRFFSPTISLHTHTRARQTLFVLRVRLSDLLESFLSLSRPTVAVTMLDVRIES